MSDEPTWVVRTPVFREAGDELSKLVDSGYEIHSTHATTAILVIVARRIEAPSDETPMPWGLDNKINGAAKSHVDRHLKKLGLTRENITKLLRLTLPYDTMTEAPETGLYAPACRHDTELQFTAGDKLQCGKCDNAKWAIIPPS